MSHVSFELVIFELLECKNINCKIQKVKTPDLIKDLISKFYGNDKSIIESKLSFLEAISKSPYFAISFIASCLFFIPSIISPISSIFISIPLLISVFKFFYCDISFYFFWISFHSNSPLLHITSLILDCS